MGSQKGWKGKSIEHYDKFLHLWKDVDLNIPEIIGAKKQLVDFKKSIVASSYNSHIFNNYLSS